MLSNLCSIQHRKCLPGGLNTPLNNPDFTGVVPPTNVIATPNTILATPFRSQRSDGTPMNSFNTPGGASVRTQNGVLAATPVRDKFNINPDESVDGSETPLIQTQVKSSLRAVLSSLPAPCNDYEIDIYDGEINEENTSVPTTEMIEDQADIDVRQQQELLEESRFRITNRLFYYISLEFFKLVIITIAVFMGKSCKSFA